MKIQPKPKNDKNEYICPSASWGEMTGLIPTPAEDVDERDSYDEIYPFSPEYRGEMN